jgi:hypothetical protein
MAFDTTLAAIQPALRIDYRPRLRKQLNNATILLQKVKRNEDNYVGEEARLTLHTGRNQGMGARTERQNLPKARNQKYDKAIFNAKYLYSTIEISGPAIAATKNMAGSIVKAVDSEIKGTAIDLPKDLNRMLWHDGSSSLTQVNDTAHTAAVAVQSTKFIKPDMEVWIIATDGTQKITTGVAGTNFDASSLAVLTVDSATQFTLEIDPGTVARTATDIVIRAGSRNTAAIGAHIEPWGLQAAISDADSGNGLTDDFGKIDRGGAGGISFWNANMLGNSGVVRALTTDLMQQAWDQCGIEGDSEPGLILTDHAGKRAYGRLLVADKRFDGALVKLDGGWSGLDFNGAPVVSDVDASLTNTPQYLRRMYFLTMSTLSFEVLSDWDWMEKDGAVLHRVENKDSYGATFFSYREFACDRPNANTVLDDLDF